MARVVVCAPDLMDQSKIRAAASIGEVSDGDASGEPTASDAGGLRFVRADRLVDAVLDDPSVRLVVVDLSRPGVLDAVSSIAAGRGERAVRVVGFGSHVDRTLLGEASARGCDEVLARSAFFGDLAAVLS